jgi:hypothetical protein
MYFSITQQGERKMVDNEKYERIPHPGEMELCLCHRCASAYYNMPDHRIERVDFLQVEKDTCTICGYRMGFDFYVWPVSSVQKRKNASVRTFVGGEGNE